ncbi:MAG TPA: MmgE/PrpD family protein [Chloroflexota bacterium]|nr:MmgE/PrpD family protein [Chloroflexota bacterium]
MERTLVEELARWVLAFDRAALPPEAVQRAKGLLLDSLGCALAAVLDETAQRTLRVATALGGTPECQIIGTPWRTSVVTAVLANGALIRLLDANDLYWGPRSGGHPSDNLAVALAVGERQNSPGREVLAAILLGYELYGRVQDLADAAGHWDHTTASALVAPAIASRLLQLDLRRTTHALALGAAHGNVLAAIRAGQLSTAKALANAIVAQTGTLATLLAAEGLTGPLGVLDGPHGWTQTVLAGADLASLVAPLDGPLRIMAVSIKAYPCIGTAQAAVAAAIQARRVISSVVAEVDRIELRMADIPFVRGQIADQARREPRSRETADHSFYYLVAIALLDGALTAHQFADGRWLDPTVRAIMARIHIQPDSRLNAYTPASFPCVLTLVLRDGTAHTVEMLYAPGHPYHPLSASEIEAKFHAAAGATLPATQRTAIIECVRTLEAEPSVRELMALLRPPQVPPLSIAERAAERE